MSSSSNKPQTFNPDTVAPPPPSYSQVCVTPLVPTSKLITLAGLTGLDPKDSTLPDTGSITTNFVAQAKTAYQNVHNALQAAGATPRDIVFVRHYIVTKTGDAELDKKEVVERGWADCWMDFMDREGEGHRPPDTVVGVAALATEGLLYEVEAWAVVSS